jgi:hypothetical protein
LLACPSSLPFALPLSFLLDAQNLEEHGLSEDKAVIRVADFFTFGEGPFDVIYDYTCAPTSSTHCVTRTAR